MPTQIISLADNSVSTSPNSSNVNVFATGTTAMQVILDTGEQVTLPELNGGNPITTSPFAFNYSSGLFPSGINPVVTPAVTPSLAQSTLSFGTVTGTSIQANWTAVPNATSYVLKRSVNSDMSGSVTAYTGSLLTFNDTGRTSGVTYYYTVTASAVGYNSSTSAMSSQMTTPSVGRVFNVGSGSGDLLIDAADPTWSPLQANDQFKIQGGSYNEISFKSLRAGSNGLINITNQNTVINVKTLKLEGTVMKINADFYQKVSGQDYGMVIANAGDGGERMRIDENGSGGFELTFKGIDNKYFNDRGWRVINNHLLYNNGAGKISLKLLDVQYCRWTNDTPDQYRGRAIDLFGGNLDTGEDSNYVETFIYKNNIQEKGQYDVVAQNVRTFEVDNIRLNDLNTTVSPAFEQNGSYAVAHYHARNIDIGGRGTASNILAKNSFGCQFRLIPFNRSSNNTKETSYIFNVIADGNRRYSATEVNNYEAGRRVYNNITTSSIAKVSNVTAIGLGSANTYTSLCLDVYDAGLTYAHNMVAINCYSGGLGLTSINGPTQEQSNNVAYANNTLTKLNLTTYVPASDSVLKGAGLYSSDVPKDYYGSTRISPDTIGAVKAL